MATETTEAAAGACVDAGGGAIGMPQLCAEWIPNQVFWLLVTLVVMYLIVSRIALPRIGAILAERKGTITGDLAAAEELKQKAVAAEKAYNDALATARSEAAKIIAAAKAATARADAEITAKAAESEARIAEIRAGAVAAVEAVAKDTAGALVEALGGKADARSVTAAVTARLKG
jgi:F-type H+-transporting ATPase subunit b